jgi:hypothetical protein
MALLDELRWHWGDAYLIHYFGDDKWVAQRRDNRSTLHAGSPDGLLSLIREDYRAHPVSRQIFGVDLPPIPSCRFPPE